MKLLFLTFATLSSNAGHLARLSQELEYLSEDNEITIVCLGKTPDDSSTKTQYRSVNFKHYPITFKGWEVNNINELVKDLNKFIDKEKTDLVVLQMEVWDLMRELGKSFKKKVSFATILHAMPFLVSPLNPTNDFEKDVIQYANSGIEDYRKDYILKHYKEALEVFRNMHVIANNETVAFYFKNYFNKIPLLVQPKSIVISSKNIKKISFKYKYDFVYMARIEKGKGLEYLSDILTRISKILSRKISLVILGRVDDKFSQECLDKLITGSQESEHFKVDYLGWVNNKEKQKILPKSGVFLYPSHYDNYPTVINEALVFGLPVVTWDILFSQMNYSSAESVKRANPLNFDEFARMAVDALYDRDNLSKKSIKFIESFNNIAMIAKQDTQLFRSIVNN